MTVNVKLFKPVKHGAEDITEINLREPIAKDVVDCGYPYSVGADESVNLNAGVIVKYISKLSDLPPSVIHQLNVADLQELTGSVMSFFGVQGT